MDSMGERTGKKSYIIPIPGKSIPITRIVFEAWKHYENKEHYFMIGQKEEGFRYDAEKEIAEFIPSREDSLNRLEAEGVEFAADQSPVDSRAIAAVMVKDLMTELSSEERLALYLRYHVGLSSCETAQAIGMSETSFRRFMKSLIKKCRCILENEL